MSMPGRATNFSLVPKIQIGSAAHPALYTMCIGVLSPEVKGQGDKPDHSRPSSAGVKNEWNYTSSPPMWVYGVHREKLPLIDTFN